MCFLCRQEAFRIAVTNAKGKAQCIAQAVGVRLGAALEVDEISQDTVQGSETGTGMEALDSDSAQLSLHQKYTNATLNYISQVHITFEVHPLQACSHKKCHKHYM